MNKLNNKLFFRSEFLNKVLGATIILTIGTVFSRFMMAGAYIVLARIFTPSEYGEYSIISSTINNFLIFASLGIGLTTTKYVSENKNKEPQLASGILGTSLLTVLILGVITGSLIFIFSEYISINILKSASLEPMLKTGALILILTAFNATQLGALLGLQSYKSTAFANILQGFFVTLGLIVGGYISGVNGAILGNLVALIILTIAIHLILKKESEKVQIRPTLISFQQDFKTIYKFALPASLSTLITSPSMWILNAMLVRTHDGFAQLGIYSAVLLFSNAIQMINGSLNNVLLPIFLSKETEITAKKEFFNYFGAWIITIIIGLPLIIFPDIISLIIGNKYSEQNTTIIFGLTMMSTLIIANRQGVARDLIISNRMWLSVFSMGQWAVTSILVFIQLKEYGAIGFAASIMISYTVNLLLFNPFFIKLKISPSYIFYNKWILFIWTSLVVLLFQKFYILKLEFRLLTSIFLIFLISYSFKKLYEKINQKSI